MELKRIQRYETCYLETRLVILEEMTKWIGGIWKLLISVISLMELFDFLIFWLDYCLFCVTSQNIKEMEKDIFGKY